MENSEDKDSTATDELDFLPAAGKRPGIWELALPSILGNLSYTVVGMVQTKFIADLGAEGLAAVGAGATNFFCDAGDTHGRERRHDGAGCSCMGSR